VITLLAFILTLGILIPVHEYAHYRVAVACGVKVERFSIGFGNVLWRRRARPDGTEFVLSAIPLGGYVRWIDDRESPPIAPDERRHTFAAQPLWQRAAIVAAGPLSNLLLAVLLFSAAFWVGVDAPKAVVGAPVAGSQAEAAGLQAGDEVLAVGAPDGAAGEPDWSPVRSFDDLQAALIDAALDRQRVYLRVRSAGERGERRVVLELERLPPKLDDAGIVRAIGVDAPYSAPVLGQIQPGPAAAAGLQTGDRVLQVDGRPVAEGRALRDTIRADVHGGVAAPQRWRVLRGERELEFTVQPRVVDEAGTAVGRIDAYVGAAPSSVTVRYGPAEGLVQGAKQTWRISAMTLKMLGRMVVGRASLDNLSGPLTIAQAAGQAVHHGLADYLGFLALVSVSLGVFNLLPLPLLDGGQLMYYIFEVLTGRPVTGVWLRWLQGSGVLLILLLMSLALYNDVARLLGLH
jgi:regulator of sigma E protease